MFTFDWNRRERKRNNRRLIMDNKRKDRFTSKEGELIITYPEKKKPKSASKPSKPDRSKTSGTRKGGN